MDKRKRPDQVIDDSPEPQYHVYIRLPFNRGDFVDPGTVNWSEKKSEALWSVLSGVSLENVDWSRLAAEFNVDVDFLLQMANYLSERHASQIRAQMLKAAAVRGSNAPSPVPGADPPGSHQMAAEPMRRTSSGAGRGSSALSMRREIAAALPKHLDDQGAAGKTTIPNRPDNSRNSSGNTAVPSPNQPGSRPGTANPPTDPPRRPLSYLATSPASQQQPAQQPQPQPQADTSAAIPPPSPAASTSPSLSSSSSSSSSSDSPVKSRIFGRPPRFLTSNTKDARGTGSGRRFPGRRPRDTTSADGDNDDDGEDDDDDDDDEPAFLPFKPRQDHNSGVGGGSSSTGQDMGATLRGDPRDFAAGRSARRTAAAAAAAAGDGGGGDGGAVLSASQTSDESLAGSAAATPAAGGLRRLGVGSGTGGMGGIGVGEGGMRTPVAAAGQRQQQQGQQTPLSPKRTAELAGRRGTGSSAGRGKGASREGSDGTPSMGSSFSDLDDASVTQSALEEALASRMQDGTIGSRMSVLGGTIGQAFRSRYLPKSNR